MSHFTRYFSIFIIFCSPFFTKAAASDTSSAGSKLSIGIWHGEIVREDGHTIPFNFQIKKIADKIIIYVINGAERLLVNNIRQQDDSVFIEMPFFDSRFALHITDEQNMDGIWIKDYGNRVVATRFQAIFNEENRYKVLLNPTFDISGRWAVHFKGIDDSTEAVGEFRQSGSQVRGTFLTPSGDYRYLDGVVNGDTLKISAFDGGHAYSFISIIQDSNKMTDGFFYAGAKNIETWVAEKN